MSRQPAFDLDNMKQLVNNNNEMLTLYETTDKKLVLLVTCGGIGLYEVLLPLDENETEQFYSQGEKYLSSLSYDICKNIESKYKDRALPVK